MISTISNGRSRRIGVALLGSLAWLVQTQPAVPCTPPFGPGSAHACNINASCLQPLPERRSVVHILAEKAGGQTVSGSGVLMNNGLGMVGQPYLLTALHLADFDGNGDVDDDEGFHFGQTAVFSFGVESSCGGGPPAEPYVVVGGTPLAVDEGFDLVLLQLHVTPADLMANAHPYYAGWDHLEVAMLPLYVHTIHHPCSDTKMVSGGESPDLFQGYIRLAGLTCGGIQPGSSGAPLFSTATRDLIGILSGTLSGDGGIFPDGEVCAGENTPIVFGPFNDFGFQFLGAQDSVPPFDPMTNIVDAWVAWQLVARARAQRES